MGILDKKLRLRISLASPDLIRRWSSGEVIRPDTLNFRTQQPEPGGLFCERIFGPTRNWSCACGTSQRAGTARRVCDTCGVEFAPARVRRERMGHIELAAPIVHPWYVRSRIISLLLNLSPRTLSAVFTYQRYLVFTVNEDARARVQQERGKESEPGWDDQLATLQPGDLLDETAYRALSALHAEVFQAKTGAEAIRDLLEKLDLDQLAERLREEITTPGKALHKAIRRLPLVEAFRTSGQSPAWMVLTVLPVLPPELRPLVPLDGGRIASSDVNELYVRVIHRNTRLKHFLAHGAPEGILNHERRLLQEACDALLDNIHSTKRLLGSHKHPLKSLTEHLQGKQGLFRHHLLGKRVDYSGRSVIVVGPDLQLHECGLPKAMACELFKPFVMRKLLDRHYAHSPRGAKRMVEQRDAVIWDLLAEVMLERVVLLNRAPTLHRLSIQAFRPRLIEGQAIRLHPLVCSAFNADFDGDQMAVHVPLSEAAQQEAHRLLLSTHNLRHPASGDPAIAPSQEIVLGCFYLTEDRPSTQRTPRIFADGTEAHLAYATGHLDLHAPIQVRIADPLVYDAPPPTAARSVQSRIETTIGRVIFNEILPHELCYRNYPMTKEHLKALVAECLATCGEKATVSLLDNMKRLGYQYATRSGMSFAMSDITMPNERETLIEVGQQRVQEIDALYQAGELTYDEWYRQVVALWSDITEQISAKLKDALDPSGPIMTIVKSGATKAKFQQIRQLSGIRGLMANPSGTIIPVPVLSNYLLGLQVWELFVAASGARKGFMDRSLQTAASGYLTRRLVEAGMEVVIGQEDCGTPDGLLFTNEESCHLGLPSMRQQIVGRVLAERAGTLEAGTLLDEQHVDPLLESGVEWVRVRSPLCCQAPSGVCQQCYGSDLATGKLVALGTAVGVIAGQSIGEPGTQLTMRTFHSGGIAHNTADITLGLPRVNDLFEARVPRHAARLAGRNGTVSAIETDEHTGQHAIHISSTTTLQDEYVIQEGYEVLVRPGEQVEQDQVLARLSSLQRNDHPAIVTARLSGQVLSHTPRQVLIGSTVHEKGTYEIPGRRPLAIREGQAVEIGTKLTTGPCNPHDILHLQGQEAAERFLINEIQQVYRGTGAFIHDKHLEVIVRQMFRCVLVAHAGDTRLLPGLIVDRSTYLQEVAAALAQGGQPASAYPVLHGLTSSVLHTTSWVAAASFQDTSRVLAYAAIRAQQDPLIGLKERLVMGKRLPLMKHQPEAEQEGLHRASTRDRLHREEV